VPEFIRVGHIKVPELIRVGRIRVLISIMVGHIRVLIRSGHLEAFFLTFLNHFLKSTLRIPIDQ